jgi:hypothetical protein
MTKRNECPILLVEDIDHKICNVVFECLVVNVYGNSLISSTFPSKFVTFSYIHTYVIGIVGITTIIVSIKGSLIKTHFKFIKKVVFYNWKISL